mgnify:CR=1 FL=1
MSSEITREEFEHLRTRIDVAEREIEGEKLVTRHILEQTRRNGDDLAVIKTRLDRVETRLDRVEQKVDGLTRDLPGIVAGVMREVLDERDRRG